MDSASHPAGGSPAKPWERAVSSSSAPFKPPSPGNTSDVVEASGTSNPGEIVASSDTASALNRNSLGRPIPSRPWEQNSYGGTYGGYGNSSYNSGYGSGLYGSSYGGYGSYGGGMYGNNMYRGGYGGMYGGGMYGGGMFNNSLGGPMGAYGMGGMGPFGDQDPNNPYGAPPSPPGFWISFLRVMQGVVNFFGRISILIDQNTQAFHMFMSALLQLFDRTGLLYGELARFVLRILGIKTTARKSPDGLPGFPEKQKAIERPKGADGAPWDAVWGQ